MCQLDIRRALNGTVACQNVAVSSVEKVFTKVGWGNKQISGVALMRCFDQKSAMNVGVEVSFQLLHGMMTVGRQERWPPS